MKQHPPASPSLSPRLPGASQARRTAVRALLGLPLLILAAACSSEPEGAQQGLGESSPASMSADMTTTSNGNSTELVPITDSEAAKPAPKKAPATALPVAPSTVSAEAPAPSTAPAAMTTPDPESEAPAPSDAAPKQEIATLGAGCFWCIEAVLEQLDGVESVVSGYIGGETLNPTYAQICTGNTGHAEVVQVTFDPTVLPYKDLLDWFWKSHDPTTLNRQGADRGTQYRSAIFVHSPAQREIAETSKKDVQPTFSDPIVTEVTDASIFYPAEKKHQGYYFDNASQGYCRMVIAPKLKKLGLKY